MSAYEGASSIFRSIFSGVEDNTLDSLKKYAVVRSYPANQVLVEQGKHGDTFYIIVEGRVSVTQTLDDGEERILSVLGPRHFFGEMALIDDRPRMATVTTLMDSTLLELTEEIFDQLVEKSPAVAYAILNTILDNLRRIDQHAIEDLTAKNAQLQQAYDDLKAAQAELVEKERLEHELAIAADVQRNLLPQVLPEFADYAFAAHLLPARQVGGDLYDVIELDDEHVGLLMADVADKSIHAALFMAVTRTLFLVESQRSLSPTTVAGEVHRHLLEVSAKDDVFVTAFYGVLHRPTGRLTYIIAGQERPLLLRPGRDVGPLPGRGRFLGMLTELTLEEYEVELQTGDRLVLFSDGVTDANNVAQERYGLERLKVFLGKHLHFNAAALIQELAWELAQWSRGAPPFDDLTMLVVEAK